MASMAESFKSSKQYSPGEVDMIGFQAKSWAAKLEESRRLCRLITKLIDESLDECQDTMWICSDDLVVRICWQIMWLIGPIKWWVKVKSQCDTNYMTYIGFFILHCIFDETSNLCSWFLHFHTYVVNHDFQFTENGFHNVVERCAVSHCKGLGSPMWHDCFCRKFRSTRWSWHLLDISGRWNGTLR